MNTGTPLTDYAMKHGRKRHTSLMVSARFAQGLERRLARAMRENRELKDRLNEFKDDIKSPTP